MSRIKPREPFPDLDLPFAGGGRFVLSERRPKHFTMLVVYRGLHCPLCQRYLGELQAKHDDFLRLDVEPIALSTDDAGRAEKAKRDWGLATLPLAYGLSIDTARSLGLYISTPIQPDQSALFAEPGLFLIRPDQTLFCASIQTMPFTRPDLGTLLDALQFITTMGYPARGEA